MKKLLKLESIKAWKLSTLIIILITIQQSIGIPMMELKFLNDVDNLYQFIYNEIFLGKLLLTAYIGIAVLAAYSVSIELQEKSFQSQIANGLSRKSYFKAKLVFFFIAGTILIIMMFFIHLLMIRYVSEIDNKWVVLINHKDVIMAMLSIFAFVSIGLLAGMLAKPLPAIGIIILLLIVEWCIMFFDTIFWEIELYYYLPIKALTNFSSDPVFQIVKLAYIFTLLFIARHLIINKDFA